MKQPRLHVGIIANNNYLVGRLHRLQTHKIHQIQINSTNI